ncbi:MAG TPA: TetR/AcrR family transcriptional regulator [Candidatus Acidoferrum sp.]|jgi:AcrR family transcriptional regulator|nr:TetR/AcrR family transcriptional regulator [Candidatus Acidoferrum sp.]
MSPRPRKVSDSQLFAATHAVMSRVGPRELTLAAIAKEAGVTAAVLVQRFGSKRALLLALSAKYSDGAGEFIAEFAKKYASPLEALRAYADCMAGMAASPAALARNLAYLQIDMTDPDFRRHLVRQARATRAGLQRLVEAASEAGELTPSVRPAQLARTIEAVLSGSLITWGFYREGTAARWMRADLEAVLEPWLRKRSGLACGRSSKR